MSYSVRVPLYPKLPFLDFTLFLFVSSGHNPDCMWNKATLVLEGAHVQFRVAFLVQDVLPHISLQVSSFS